MAAGIAAATGATLGTLAEGGNAAGAYLAGAVPHRDAGRHQERRRRQERARNARRSRRRPIYCSVASSPGPMRLGADAAAGARRRELRGRRHAVRRRHAEVGGARAAADLHVRRNFGHLRESRRPVAELRRRGEAAGRSAPRLEGAARARQPRGRRGLRLPVFGRSARRTARAVRRTSPRAPTRARTKPRSARRDARVDRRAHVRRSMRCCAARRRCSGRAKARARPWRMAEARAHERLSISDTGRAVRSWPDYVQFHVLDPRASPSR